MRVQLLAGSALTAAALALLASLFTTTPGRRRPPPTTRSTSPAPTCSTAPACSAATPPPCARRSTGSSRSAESSSSSSTSTSSPAPRATRTGPTRPRSRAVSATATSCWRSRPTSACYSVSVADAFPLSDGQLADMATNRLIPGLRDDDWAGGAIAYADGLSDALAPSPVPFVIGGVAVAGVGTALIVGAVRRRRAKKKVLDDAAADIKTLELRAGKLLVGLDDALKTSEQELGFRRGPVRRRADPRLPRGARPTRRRPRSRPSRSSTSSTTPSPRRRSSTAR